MIDCFWQFVSKRLQGVLRKFEGFHGNFKDVSRVFQGGQSTTKFSPFHKYLILKNIQIRTKDFWYHCSWDAVYNNVADLFHWKYLSPIRTGCPRAWPAPSPGRWPCSTCYVARISPWSRPGPCLVNGGVLHDWPQWDLGTWLHVWLWLVWQGYLVKQGLYRDTFLHAAVTASIPS